ncbi:MAG TPA: fumarylacetoacetate hydrolase family protein [Methanomassiliicoccales archaeon]|nr:fumarylacetoacetate hydrolase family protein [Methanomassiliicoccales archaeon]
MRAGKVVCIGQNYHAHIKELKSEVPTEPVIFLKPASALIGNDDPILLPRGIGRIDYEGELAVIIGKSARRVSPKAALKHVEAAAVFNDVTARDVQSKARKAGLPWSLAKGMDTFAPMSAPKPLEEVGDLRALKVQTRLNGDMRQDGRTADMIFPVEELVAYISKYMTLEPGDVIATGTPEGVGPLKDGDRIEIVIPGVGKLSNPVVNATD